MPATRRYITILSLGLPIIGGMLSQSVINLVDAALVGQLGAAALAGVGIGSYANFVAISLILGLSSGVQSLVARRNGEGRHGESARPVHWGIFISFVYALPLSILFITQSEYLINLLNNAPAVQEIASEYFDYRTAAMLAIGLNLSFRGWWNGTQRPVIYVKVLLLTHLLNIAVSYALIFGHFGLPRMGAPGAGLGTAIALYTGCIANALLVWRDARQAGFMRWRRQSSSAIISLLRLSIPHSLQQLLFALAICALIWIVGYLGTQEQAVAHVLINLALFLILPAVGFGVAATSLVSHALGAGNTRGAYRWGWAVWRTALVVVALLSLPLWLIPETVLGVFLQSEALIQKATLPLQLTAAGICVDVAGIVFTQALLGAGANRTVLLISSLGQWFFFLPLAWLMGPVLGFGLVGIWWVQLLYRALSSLVFIHIWKTRKWIHITI
ncbi:MATE family efflux transporter [Pontibacter sp. JAM-7]|uniref:MATE family efflux transporter n=1 Tax=Pontibacter sp. JAM-7 TaxID=3366581 RepID=UPI003AF7CD6B